MAVRPGLKYSGLTIEQNYFNNLPDIVFDNQIGYRIGLEFELVMPFNNNKWAFVFEPTYQSFQGETHIPQNDVVIDYRSVEIPMGARYYMYLNDKSRLFVNGFLLMDLPLNSKVEFSNRVDAEIDSQPNLAFGAGFSYNQRYSVEFRYQTTRELFDTYTIYASKYSTVALIAGIKLF